MTNSKTSNNNFSALKIFGFFSLSLFLLIMLVSVFIIIPKVNTLLTEQHNKDVQIELALEVALFERFVESQYIVIQDLATYPSLVSTVMLSDKGNIKALELLDNIIINGKKGRLILQDIAGDVLIKTSNNIKASYTKNNAWIDPLLNETKAYDFQLLGQNGDFFTYKISVPIYNHGFIEGVLSSEITTSIKDVFLAKSLNGQIAFKLIQNDSIVETSNEHITQPNEQSLYLSNANLTFFYITDNAPIYEALRIQKNTILLVLLFSFILLFLLFGLLGYWRLFNNIKGQKLTIPFYKVYLLPLCIFVVGVGASLIVYQLMLSQQKQSINTALTFQSKAQVEELHKQILSNVTVLDALDAYHHSSNLITRKEFADFAEPLINNDLGLKFSSWVPIVAHNEIGQYQEKALLDEVIKFKLTEYDNNKLTDVGVRGSYFPFYYLTPMQGNENLLGFDIGSNHEVLVALKQAEASKNTIITPKLSLFNEIDNPIDLLMIRPVFEDISKNKQNFDNKLSGFIVLGICIEGSAGVFSTGEFDELALTIEDISNTDKTGLIFSNVNKNNTFVYEKVLSVANRSWRISVYHTGNNVPNEWTAWLAFFIGLSLSIFLAIGLAYMIRRGNIVESLVKVRTAQLAESEEQHRAIFENAVDGLITIDNMGNIERFNRAAERIFGYSAAEVVGKNVKVLMPEPYHKEHDGYLSNYHKTKTKKIIGIGRTVSGKRKNGSVFPMELSVSEIKLNNTKKFSGIVRDITDRVALEVEREKFIEKLTDSNEELARFAFVCSHDLQEPLRMIRSFSEKLQEHLTIKLENDEKGKKYFHFVIDGAVRAQALISDILTYSSIESDTKILEEVSVEKLIKIISENILIGTESKGEITFDELPVLTGNKTQLLQLFQNLINNGMKYQRADTIPHVHVGLTEKDEYWIFSIKDNGIGMEERHFKKIFEVFQRLHGRKAYSGTGVGLSICKKVVERHNGSIWVESEKGSGSVFYVQLPKNNL